MAKDTKWLKLTIKCPIALKACTHMSILVGSALESALDLADSNADAPADI